MWWPYLYQRNWQVLQKQDSPNSAKSQLLNIYQQRPTLLSEKIGGHHCKLEEPHKVLLHANTVLQGKPMLSVRIIVCKNQSL